MSDRRFATVVERRKKWDVLFAVSYAPVTPGDMAAMKLSGKSTGLTKAAAETLAEVVEAFRSEQEGVKRPKRKREPEAGPVKLELGSKDPPKKSEKTSLLPRRKSR